MKRFGTLFLIFFTFLAVSARGQVPQALHPATQLSSAPTVAINRSGATPILLSSGGQPLATQIDSVLYYGDTSGGNAWVYVPVLDQASGDSLGYYGVSQDGLFYYQNEDTIGPTDFGFYPPGSNVVVDTTAFDTMYNRVMALRVNTPTDIKSPRLIGVDVTLFPIALNPTDRIKILVVPVADEQFGDNNYYPIPQIFGPYIDSGSVDASTITVGQINTVHLNISKVLYSGSKILYPQFGVCVYVDGPNFATDTVGYVLDQNLNSTFTTALTIDTDGSLGVTGEPMRTYRLNLDAGNLNIRNEPGPAYVGGGGGFFINFEQLDPTQQPAALTGEAYDGNLLLTTYFSGTSLAVTPGGANENSLDGIYPNPVGTSSAINYTLAQSGPVSLTVYNTLGEQVGTVVNGVQGGGEHSATFVPGTLPNGMYYYKLQSGDFTATRTMVINR